MISWSHIVDKMQVNIQGVEHDLRQIEKIDSRPYNNDDYTQRVVQELGSKYTNEQQQLWANFVSSIGRHRQKMLRDKI